MSDRSMGVFLHAASWLLRLLPASGFGPLAGLLAHCRWITPRDVRLMRRNLAVVLGLPSGVAGGARPGVALRAAPDRDRAGDGTA